MTDLEIIGYTVSAIVVILLTISCILCYVSKKYNEKMKAPVSAACTAYIVAMVLREVGFIYLVPEESTWHGQLVAVTGTGVLVYLAYGTWKLRQMREKTRQTVMDYLRRTLGSYYDKDWLEDLADIYMDRLEIDDEDKETLALIRKKARVVITKCTMTSEAKRLLIHTPREYAEQIAHLCATYATAINATEKEYSDLDDLQLDSFKKQAAAIRECVGEDVPMIKAQLEDSEENFKKAWELCWTKYNEVLKV